MSDARADSALRPDRQLSPSEAQEYLDAPLTEAEREDVRTLVEWFRHRYPTPLERLAYVRRAYARWQRTRAIVARRSHEVSDDASR
jgi:hypothetical protein